MVLSLLHSFTVYNTLCVCVCLLQHCNALKPETRSDIGFSRFLPTVKATHHFGLYFELCRFRPCSVLATVSCYCLVHTPHTHTPSTLLHFLQSDDITELHAFYTLLPTLFWSVPLLFFCCFFFSLSLSLFLRASFTSTHCTRFQIKDQGIILTILTILVYSTQEVLILVSANLGNQIPFACFCAFQAFRMSIIGMSSLHSYT